MKIEGTDWLYLFLIGIILTVLLNGSLITLLLSFALVWWIQRIGDYWESR